MDIIDRARYYADCDLCIKCTRATGEPCVTPCDQFNNIVALVEKEREISERAFCESQDCAAYHREGKGCIYKDNCYLLSKFREALEK